MPTAAPVSSSSSNHRCGSDNKSGGSVTAKVADTFDCHTAAESPQSSSSSTGTTSTTRYSSILYNGKIGTLVLNHARLLFAGLSGISISIPWPLVERHELASSDNNVDVRLFLLNGQTVELQFSESQHLDEVCQDLTSRIRLHTTRMNSSAKKPISSTTCTTAATKDSDGGETGSSTSSMDLEDYHEAATVSEHTMEKIDQVVEELEHDLLLANTTLGAAPDHDHDHEADHDEETQSLLLANENQMLRESVNSLLSEVGKLRRQEDDYKSRVMCLESQFETFRRDWRRSSASMHTATSSTGINSSFHTAAQDDGSIAPLELQNSSTRQLKGPAHGVSWGVLPEYTHSSHNLNDGNQDSRFKIHPISSVRLGEQQSVGDLTTMRNTPQDDDAAEEAESSLEGEDDNTKDIQRSTSPLGAGMLEFANMAPRPFVVTESVHTEEGMNMIRRKLRFRKSEVTGQMAYAKTLPSDTYGFLMVAPTISAPFLMGVIVWCMQMITFTLMAISIVEEKAFNNRLGIPPNVDTKVRVVQFIAILIAVVTQDDLMKGLDLIRTRKSRSFLEAYPHSNFTKIAVCITARCVEGCLGLVTSFLLIITSETIYYLLLNFTALEFVTQLDEAFFGLSLYGFAGKTCEVASKAVESTTYYVHTRVFRMRKIFFFGLIGSAMISGWSVIVNRQRNGHFLCRTIRVQFGDDLRPELATFSGLYDQVTDNSGLELDSADKGAVRTNQHVRYIARNNHSAVFAFCDEGFWSFQYSNAGNLERADPCSNWVVRSSSTDAYDIVLLNTQRWFVRDDLSREIFLEPFVLLCQDCGESKNNCSGRGVCDDAVCTCEKGYYGAQCEFTEPCGRVVMDSRFTGFLGTRRWSQSYNLFRVDLEIVNSYGRPVYISDLGDNHYDLMYFTGRRWAVSFSEQLSDHFPSTLSGSIAAKKVIAEWFQTFHAHWAEFNAGFLSEPTDLLTPGDSQSPVGLQWYTAKERHGDQVEIQTPDMVQPPVEGRLLCAVCNNETNPCLYDGSCVLGSCVCKTGSSGALCESPPLGNGRCDDFLNSPQYDLDGGDCCPATCESSDFSCGREETGYGYIGYNCRLPPDEWRLHGEKLLTGSDAAEFGKSVALSRRGNFLVVGAPGASRVYVYDRDGKHWIPRGSPLVGIEGSYFGHEVRVASREDNLWSTPRFNVPYTIAVGSPLSNNGTVDIYTCSTDESGGCTQKSHEFSKYSVFDLSEDGTTVALVDQTEQHSTRPQVRFVSLSRGGTPTAEEVVDAPFSERQWRRDANGTSSVWYDIYYVSLSRDGSTMAIQTVVVDLLLLGDFTCSSITSDCAPIFVTYSVVTENKTDVLMEESVNSLIGTRPIVISQNGLVVAYASLDCKDAMAKFFRWDGTQWVEHPSLPKYPEGDCTDDFADDPVAISMSADGETIAVGFRGTVSIYDFNGTMWNSVGDAYAESETVLGASIPETSVSIASVDGSSLAIGIPQTDASDNGFAGVYSTPRRKMVCNEDRNLLHMSLTTDDKPGQLSWTLFDNETETITHQIKPGYYMHQYATFVHEVCISDSSCSVVTFYDTQEALDFSPNGLKAPGRVDMIVDHKPIIEGGPFSGAAKRVFIGDSCLECSSGHDLLRMFMRSCEPVGWQLVDHVGKTLFEGAAANITVDTIRDPEWLNGTVPNTCDKQTYWEDVCINYDEDCYTFYVFLFRHPDATDDAYQIYDDDFFFGTGKTEYILYLGDKEIHRDHVTEEGQSAYFVGNCTEEG